MKLPQSLNVLLLGSGAREHAFAWKIRQNTRVANFYTAPGNAGTATLGTNVDLQPTNFGSLKQFVLLNNINLIVCGNEEPLVRGIYDFVHEDGEIHHVPVIGPSMAGARLEGSKEFAKGFMSRHNIPTAAYQSFTKTTLEEGRRFLESLRPPYVLKADGLAAGKGVIISDDLAQAQAELEEMLCGKFGQAGSTVVIEEYLDGIECSVFVATDGKDYVVLPEAKDYKRVGEGDTGPNTGGMGAVSPVPFADAAYMEKVRERIIEPTVAGLASENITYKGFIFIGLMNVDEEPYVIEYNVRMGDPETEVVLPRIESDLVDMFEAIAFGGLRQYELNVSPNAVATVICTSGGYPGDYEKGKEITGIPAGDRWPEGSLVFQAGTAARAGKLLTDGGRVLAVTSSGKNIEDAISRSYSTVGGIEFDGMYFRRDIGADLTGK